MELPYDLNAFFTKTLQGFNGTKLVDKVKAITAEAGTLTMDNLKAMAESGKIFAEGVQKMGSEFVADSQTVFSTLSEDAKAITTAGGPSEALKAQGEIARRQFEHGLAYASKQSEAVLKLASDSMAPISRQATKVVDLIKAA